MIGLTTYRDYFALKGRSSKFESLHQYAIDIQEFLEEKVEIVPTLIFKKGEETYDKYDRLLVFEHPTSMLQNQKNGFTTPNIETHFLQLEKLFEYEGEVISYNFESQDSERWIKGIEARRKNPRTSFFNIPTDGEFHTFFTDLLSNSITKEVNEFRSSRINWVIGDSHAPMMWKPETTTYSIPARTLHRCLNEGLKTLTSNSDHVQSLTLCFGNIDLRHHLARQDDPKVAAEKLAKEYIKQAEGYDCQVSVCELLPVMGSDQLVMKSYFYKEEPHFGSTKLRTELKNIFNETLNSSAKTVEVLRVPNSLIDQDGLMNKDAIEKTKGGIHLSPFYYEHAASTNIITPEHAWLAK